MNSSTQSLLLALTLALGTQAAPVQDDRPPTEPPPPDFRLEPLTTRYARTATKITINSSIRYFEGMDLQEADHVDGYTADVELTVPFLKRFQIRLYYPFYTEGEARLTDAGDPLEGTTIDIEGDGGIFDFPSANLDVQILKPDSPHGLNLSAFAGYGMVLESLETSVDDLYNHKGKVVLFGVRADKTFTERLTGIANVGGRYYYQSDDLNPGADDDDDVFLFMDASAAVVYELCAQRVYPALELVYQGDLDTYNNIHLDPQVIFPICSNFELKAGAGVGLNDDGERWFARLQGALRF